MILDFNPRYEVVNVRSADQRSTAPIIPYQQFAFTKLYFPNNFLRLFSRLCRLFARFCRVIFHKCSEFDQICQIAKSQKTRSFKAETPHFPVITRRESENALSSTFFS